MKTKDLMIRKMKIEDLKNTKIYLSNEDDRVKFQEKVFKLGVKWPVSGKNVENTEHMFYFIDSDLDLSYGSSPFEKPFFIVDGSKQIFLDDVLAIEEPKKKCKFKPFDKVLVVNNNNVWVPRFFSRYDGEDTHPFETTDGSCYKTCVPYEGNEHIVGKQKV